MSSPRDMVRVYGGEEASRRVDDWRERQVVRVAQDILEGASQEDAFVYAGFALTALPHRAVAPTEKWVRENGPCRLVVEAGPDPQHPHRPDLIGIPYGSLARCILIYFQTEAVKNRTREIELGPSMNSWCMRIGLGVGGTTYKRFYSQLARIQAATLYFTYSSADGKTTAWDRDAIVKQGFLFHSAGVDNRQSALWKETVTLGETFYKNLTSHPVLLSETAIHALKAHSQAIDIYIWLAFRLPHLERELFLTWPAVKKQFGEHYGRLRKFREQFSRNLDLALAAYPGAFVKADERGIKLFPSPAPNERRLIPVAQSPTAVPNGTS